MNPQVDCLRVGLLAACALMSACAPNTSEPVKDAAETRYRQAWTGKSASVPNPGVNEGPLRACPAQGAGSPVCEYHRLTPPPEVKNLTVAITPAEGAEAEDWDFAVFDDQDVMVAASASGGPYESVVFPTNGSGYYEVRVQPYLVTPGATYHGTAAQSDTTVDAEPSCGYNPLSGETYPDQFGIAGVTDDGREIELSVAVLLDGVDPQLAAEVMRRAADGYAPLRIRLTVAGTAVLPLVSNISDQMIQETKDRTGGRPPFDADIAAVFTTKQMQAATGGAGTVLGQADCIGGIRAPYNSYLVATIEPEDPFVLGPVSLDVERGPETMAHEIGHLMGAHHHYGNCVEGISAEDLVNGDLSPCDLMFPSVEPLSMIFSTAAGATVRGHAVAYASP